MSNQYFDFKQFRINQDKCSMKVSTDACLLASIVAAHAKSESKIIDIGTGTGVIALMLAQKFQVAVDGVEINQEAFLQATENFASSPWVDRLSAIHADVNKYATEQTIPKYDLLVSNPPFFQHDLWSKTKGKTQARHDISLSLEQLASCVPSLLKDEGECWLVLPIHLEESCLAIWKMQGYYLHKKWLVVPKEGKSPHRFVAQFKKKSPENIFQGTIMITRQDQYSNEYLSLMKDYYLFA